MIRGLLLVVALLGLGACANQPAVNPMRPEATVAQSVSVTVHGPGVPLELHWFRNSAERVALYMQIYGLATESVRSLAAGLAPQSWAVILDVDETVLDNSEYQARLAITASGYSSSSWDAWVHERRAIALPGAVAFLHAVRADLHGRVVLVTNRTLDDCSDTEANLRAQMLEYDAILCAPKGSDGKWVLDKNPRFQQVQTRATQGLGPLKVLAYVGDNIEDFPNLSQAHPGDSSHFGHDYFVLPNPMYGSWVTNLYR